jgi:hypothetical protein
MTEREAAEQRLNADWNNYSDPANKPKPFDSLFERVVALSMENARLKVTVKTLSQQLGNSFKSEGCSCCQHIEAHEEAKARPAKMLKVPKYKRKERIK